MTKQPKVTLNASREIPFNQLVLSQTNVRRVKAGVSIDALAADIARRGLLQSLTVRVQRDPDGAETGLFEVPAGGRRFRALQQLVKARRLGKTEPVPCVVRDDERISAEEDSLAENVHREALHPIDQFRAMQALVGQGTDIETVAAMFMVTPAVVRQRLKLATVSPRLLEIYAEDGMTLEQLMAFSVSDDQERQEQVWELLQSSYNRQPYFIRAKLTEHAVRASDKRVRFLGLDAYEAAGGYVLRDLFEADDGGWLQDVALLDNLVDAKLRAEAEAIAAEGWKWIAIAVDLAYGHQFELRALDGEEVPLDADDAARLTALREEADRLDAEWSDADDIPDAVDARIAVLDEEIAALVTRPLLYAPEDIARAGVFVSIERDGALIVERGFVRPEDEPEARPAFDGDAAVGQDVPAGDDFIPGPTIVSISEDPAGMDDTDNGQPDLLRPLPDRLVTELTAHRTLALRDAMASAPEVAFLTTLHAFVLDTFYRYGGGETCMELTVRSVSLGSLAPGLADCEAARSIDARHARWSDRLPEATADVWDMLLALNEDDRLALLAHCASFGLNAVWEPATRFNEGRVSARTIDGRVAHSHFVARVAGLDMVAAGWAATVDNYLGRVTKAHIVTAVAEACGQEAASRLAGLKKADIARVAEQQLAGTGWLAEPLRTIPSNPAATDESPSQPATPGRPGTAGGEGDGGAMAIAAE